MKKFKKTYIEIANACNLNCEFCPKCERNPEFMKIELFEKILSQIKNHSKHIYFHVKGEPSLHPQLGKFLDAAHTHGYKVNITTIGNIQYTHFEDIIENERANTLYNGFSNRNVVEPLCQKCDYRRKFNS